jgi:hypothetical protein
VLNIALESGLQARKFAGTYGKGTWVDWDTPHIIALCGVLWWSLCSTKADGTWDEFRDMAVRKGFTENDEDKNWTRMFIRPAETRWMVKWGAMELVDQRWEGIQRITNWAKRIYLKQFYDSYWKSMHDLCRIPMLRVYAKFARVVKAFLGDWAYNWLKGSNKDIIVRGRRLPPGHRMADVAEFATEFVRRIRILFSASARHLFRETLDCFESILCEDGRKGE